MAKLIFNGEKFDGRVYEIAAARTTVGRSDANTLSIHDGSVSERHCEIYDNGADLIVRDLGSTNGTVINGKVLRNAQDAIAHGGTIKFGGVEARLELSPANSTSDAGTDITAIHSYARHQNSAPRPTPSSTVLKASPLTDSYENTMILLSANASVASLAPTPAANESPSRRSKYIWSLVIAALGLGFLIWGLMR
jgi:pSer/pThr/pTyr-binding forkhead associated (FHA) protein